MTNRTIALTGGLQLPAIGLGTWPMDDAEATRVVAEAIGLGYRHIDTAENYRNEAGVGAGVRACGVPREELWITTKFNREWHRDPAAGLRGNLDRLGLDYVDLLLIHWPNPDQDAYVTAWEGMLELREQGLVRAIGTSNFLPEHLQRLLDATGQAPQVNQIELHPYHTQDAVRAWTDAHGVATTAWSPLGRGGQDGLLDDPVVLELAEAHGVTPGQVVLAWDVQQGICAIPKSSDAQRLARNLDVFEVGLTGAELARLSALEPPHPIDHLDPRTFGH